MKYAKSTPKFLNLFMFWGRGGGYLAPQKVSLNKFFSRRKVAKYANMLKKQVNA